MGKLHVRLPQYLRQPDAFELVKLAVLHLCSFARAT